MKIAYIGQKVISTSFGGVAVHVEGIATGLACRSLRADVFVRNWFIRLVGLPSTEAYRYFFHGHFIQSAWVLLLIVAWRRSMQYSNTTTSFLTPRLGFFISPSSTFAGSR